MHKIGFFYRILENFLLYSKKNSLKSYIFVKKLKYSLNILFNY